MPNDAKEQAKTYDSKAARYKSVMRANARGWTPDKYSRMGIYVYLYDRIRGRPNGFGLDNNDVSFRIRDYIRDHFDELVKKYHIDSIPNVDFSSEAAKKQFIAEMDEYNEHALEIDQNMPSAREMNYFLEDVANDRRKHFESVRRSVVFKSGEYTKDGKGDGYSNGYLISERMQKRREIRNQKMYIRREGFWAGLKGIGALASAGGLVLGGIALFSPAILGLGPAFAASFLARGLVGIVGAVAGAFGFKQFGSGLSFSLGKIFSQRRKLRELKLLDGEKGKRGLKAIEREIKVNSQVRNIYNDYGKMGKNGALPTEKEFRAYVRRHYPAAYKSDMVNLYSLYRDAGYYHSAEKGKLREVMRFIGHNEVTETKNKEIPIERDDRYNATFNNGTGKGADGKFTSMENYRATLREFKDDENLYNSSNMQKEYRRHEWNASKALLNIYDNAMFDEPYSNRASAENVKMAEDELIKERLAKHPDGDKTLYINNSLRFIQAEEKLDSSTNDRLDQTLGVSVKAQLSRSAEDITHGCETLGVDPSSSEYAEVQSIAENIQNMSVKSEASSLRSRISSAGISSQAKHYLETMVRYRENESKVTPSEIQNAIGLASSTGEVAALKNKIMTLINSLERVEVDGQFVMVGTYNGETYNIDEIRKLLYESGYKLKGTDSFVSAETFYGFPEDMKVDYELSTYLSNDEIDKVSSLLTQQISAVELRYKNSVRGSAVDMVRNGSVRDNLTEILDEISKFQYEDLVDESKASAISTLYRDKIMKAAPAEIREYLFMRLKQRVEEAFLIKINKNNAYLASDGKSIEELSLDLKTISGTIFLDQSQKDRLISAIEPKMKKAFDIQLTEMEKYLLKDLEEGKNTYRERLEKYIKKPFNMGGFSELFGDGGRRTNDIIDILKRINALNVGIQLQDYLTASAEGVSKVIDPDAGSTRAILRVLFKKSAKETGEGDREMESPFVKEIKEISNKMSRRGLSGLKSNGATPGDSIISDFNDYVNQLVPGLRLDTERALPEVATGKPDEKLALLLLVKKNALTALKAQLKKYVTDPNRGNEIEYITKSGSANVAGIKAAWEELCAKIDRAISEVSKDPRCREVLDGINSGSALKVLNEAISSNKMVGFVNSPSVEGYERS